MNKKLATGLKQKCYGRGPSSPVGRQLCMRNIRINLYLRGGDCSCAEVAAWPRRLGLPRHALSRDALGLIQLCHPLGSLSPTGRLFAVRSSKSLPTSLLTAGSRCGFFTNDPLFGATLTARASATTAVGGWCVSVECQDPSITVIRVVRRVLVLATGGFQVLSRLSATLTASHCRGGRWHRVDAFSLVRRQRSADVGASIILLNSSSYRNCLSSPETIILGVSASFCIIIELFIKNIILKKIFVNQGYRYMY